MQPAVPHTSRELLPPGADPREVLQRVFGLPEFRPNQEQVCRALLERQSALVVMPTGAGKSLCYQLPGVMLPGPTLVVSPLIALMEEQAARLRALGQRAETLHAGRSRDVLRQVYSQYSRGMIDFLLLAPERLASPELTALLARRQPALLAIDEAHCISEWGHDFRPEYRSIGQVLTQCERSVVVALTATATERVQADILARLGLPNARRFVFGFRRRELAIEMERVPPARRAARCQNLLLGRGRLPAIVYTPTRKEAEAKAHALSCLGAVAYHAGLHPEERARIAQGFAQGSLQVVVATIAFGMGIDKANVRTVVHTALPGSVEAYYQEIGRAGRDGKASRAVLFYSEADLRTHDFFLERDYPEPAQVARVYRSLLGAHTSRQQLLEQSGLDELSFDKCLQKVVLFGGEALRQGELPKGRATPSWLEQYAEQRRLRRASVEAMRELADGASCRMLQLLRHFGDAADRDGPCGQCDVCAPKRALTRRSPKPVSVESQAAKRILRALAERDHRAQGSLFRELETGGLGRAPFDRLLSELARAGYVEVRQAHFEKQGQTITYQRVSLTPKGHHASSLGQVPLFPAAVVDAEETLQARTAQVHSAQVHSAQAHSAQVHSAQARTAQVPSAAGSSAADRAARGRTGPGERELYAALLVWRAKLAYDKPAHRVLGTAALAEIARRRPQSEAELVSIRGVTRAFVAKYGGLLLAFLRGPH